MATKKSNKPDGKPAEANKTEATEPEEKSGALAKAVSAKTSAAKTEPVVLDQPEQAAKEAEENPDEAENASELASGKPESDAPPRPSESESQPKRRSGLGVFFGLIAGGVLAAALGFFGADYINPPPEIPDYSGEIQALNSEYSKEISSLQARVAELEAAEANAPLAKLEQEIADLKSALDAQSSMMAARLADSQATLDAKLAELESARARLGENLSATGGEISAATAELVARYGAEIDNLKAQGKALSERLDAVSDKAGQQLDEARQKVGELTEKISDAASSVDLTLARERLNAAVASGKAYADQLVAIAKQAAIDIPEALMKGADKGVAPMLELQQDFPGAARNALKASIEAEAGPGIGAKLKAFLKAQLGARSLEEKAGDDPDAILSQAEAALDRGELRQSVDLVGRLPDAGKAEMTDWLDAARSRLAVQDALTKFNQALDAKQ